MWAVVVAGGVACMPTPLIPLYNLCLFFALSYRVVFGRGLGLGLRLGLGA